MVKSIELRIKNRSLKWGARTYLMGIINVTSDSFSGDGLLKREKRVSSENNRELNDFVQDVLKFAHIFVTAGADFLDVGGESTRPGAKPLKIQDELGVVIPVVRALASQFDVPISIDTYKSEVARAALEAGASMINDVWGLQADAEMSTVAAEYAVPIILMHNRSSWMQAEVKEQLGGRYIGVKYDNLIEDIKNELLECVDKALNAGIKEENIILDPGIGFGKTVEQNLEIIDQLQAIRSLGYPILVGPSRKSFIGYTLDRPPDQRLEGTAAAVVISIVRGADIIRVHDVEFMSQVIRMSDAIVRHDLDNNV